MNKVRVQLRDKHSCFYDRKNQIFISSPDPVEVEETAKIAEGIRLGALIKVTDGEDKGGKKEGEDEKARKELEEKTRKELEQKEHDEKVKAAHELIKSLSEDKPDFAATDYGVLKDWAAVLGLTPASKKKEDYIAALTEAVASFEKDED